MNSTPKSALLKLLKKMLPSLSQREMTEEGLHLALLEGEKSGVVESRERTMVEGVFYLGDKPVSAFMTHRSEITWLDINSSPEESRSAVESAKYQGYFPVADGELDQAAGAVSSLDVFRALLDDPWPGLKKIMRPPHFIPETMPAIKAFEAFKKADANDLFVMDEYGGFAGILTIRNLIEEIVGVLSASGEEGETIVKQEDGTWLADGSLSIDDVAGELGLESLSGEQNEYHTLAGFILYLAEDIPKTGASFDYEGFRFKVVKLDNNRIDKIEIRQIKN